MISIWFLLYILVSVDCHIYVLQHIVYTTLFSPSTCVSVCLSLYLYLSLCLSIWLSFYLSVCLSDCLFICLCVCLCLSVCLSVCTVKFLVESAFKLNIFWNCLFSALHSLSMHSLSVCLSVKMFLYLPYCLLMFIIYPFICSSYSQRHLWTIYLLLLFFLFFILSSFFFFV